MGIGEGVPSSCSEAHVGTYVQLSQEWVTTSRRLLAGSPKHSLMVAPRPFLPSSLYREIVLPTRSWTGDEGKPKPFRPLETLSSSFYQPALVAESSSVTLTDDLGWIVSTVEQPQSRSLGDDLPNEEAITRKKLLSQIRLKGRGGGKVTCLPNISQLKMRLPVLSHTAFFPLKGAAKFRQCPGGKMGNGGGGGAGGEGFGGGAWGSSSVLASSGMASSSLVTGRGGGAGDDDDDDPYNRNRPVEMPREHYMEMTSFEFDPLRDIPNIDDLLFMDGLDIPSLETVPPNPAFCESRSAPVFREEPSDPAPLTPAPPMTPGAPMTPVCSGPLTPSGSTYLTDPIQAMSLNPAPAQRGSTLSLGLNYGGGGRARPVAVPASDPVPGSLVSPHQAQTPEKAELENLLDISRLLRKNSGDRSHPRPPSRRSVGARRMPYTTPQPSRYHFPTHSLGRVANPRVLVEQRTAVPPPPDQRVQSLSPRAGRHDSGGGGGGDLHFFKTTFVVQGNRLVIDVLVDSSIPADNQKTAYAAIGHCYQMCIRYKECLEEDCSLAVAMPSRAKFCNFNFDFQRSKLSFDMPSDCLRLEKWMERDNDRDINSRQLIVQQVLNAFVSLFQGANEVCFWGSFEVWIATDLKVYLFIDFNKSLQVQKHYSTLRHQNPRLEDCRALERLYATLLKPYLNCDLTWASPQLSTVYVTFENLLSNPSQCIQNMPLLARVLGERRVCKLEVASNLLLSVQYTVYCAEHEPLSSALTVLERLLPTSVCNHWEVRRARDYIPVNTTDIAARGCPRQFLIVPHPDDLPLNPATLYLASRSQGLLLDAAGL